MSKTFTVPESTRTITFTHFWLSFLLLVLLQWALAECGALEQPPSPIEPVPVAPGSPPPSPVEPVPVAPGALRPPQEQLLTPIPQQFDWMRREVRPNPFLESILRLRGVTPRLLTSISLIEEFSDNFFLTQDDPQDEYRTLLNIGTVYRGESGRGFVSLANVLSGAYDAIAGEASLAFANLSLNAGYQLLPRLALSISESFIRSDEVEEATPAAVRRERQPFAQNIISPQIRYSLTPTTALSGGYTNTLVWNEDSSQDNIDTSSIDQNDVEGNSVSHDFTVGLQHWLRRDLNSSMGYTFSTIDRENEVDTRSHAVEADLSYLISPITSASFHAFGVLNNRLMGASDIGSSEGDSRIFGVSFGVRRQLTPFLGAFAALGPTVVMRENLPTRVFANWQVRLDGNIPITRDISLSLLTEQGIEDTAGDVEDVGLVLAQSATLTLNYSVTRLLLASVFANIARTQLLENIATDVSTQNEDFTYWSTGLRLSYALTPIWSLSAGYRYQHRDSDIPESSVNDPGLAGKYRENRVILSLTAAFSAF